MNWKIENMPEKYAALSQKTYKAAYLFISFCKLEKILLSHSEISRPWFLKWIMKQEICYYNQLITSFAEEMNWKNREHTLTLEPPELFISLKRAAMNTE
ncbi:hypothetical protein [Sporolactobacillus nakayamae]|uniref:Uncharacterized protein n=1 Tax=Sporolactobacillus nakayamae TaxID=269670 RepID=A0A1I2UE39_9BACL|nr:hypothetical protein [Sporolactobacillus nakayamae]SFG75308.1 hypothetical protein SAMN02982927_02661 [Sporolactobacillus nakayamae]